MEAPMSKEQHTLTLKVMRLSKPSFASYHPVLLEDDEMVASTVNECEEQHICPELEHFGLTDTLILPQSFGNIYLGEQFSSFISVHNDGQCAAADVGIKAELQTSSQRVTLADTTMVPDKLLTSSNSIDMVVRHEIKEFGIHILVCSVHYTMVGGERMFFRKFFKFQVMNPLAVKTKVYNIEQDVFLEAQVQNISAGPMLIERVTFEPLAPLLSIDLNRLDVLDARGIRENKVMEDEVVREGIDEEVYRLVTNTFGEVPYLPANDVWQYMFRIYSPTEGDAVLKDATAIGKLDIVWKTNMGEQGHLQTSLLPRKQTISCDVKMFLSCSPKEVVLETPFTIDVNIINTTDRKMSLRLYAIKSKMSGILVNGVSGKYLGGFPPGASQVVSVSLFPVSPGLHHVNGLRVVDLITGKSYDFDGLADCFVVQGSIEKHRT